MGRLARAKDPLMRKDPPSEKRSRLLVSEVSELYGAEPQGNPTAAAFRAFCASRRAHTHRQGLLPAFIDSLPSSVGTSSIPTYLRNLRREVRCHSGDLATLHRNFSLAVADCDEGRPFEISTSELARLIAACPTRWALFLFLLFATGARARDISRLRSLSQVSRHQQMRSVFSGE